MLLRSLTKHVRDQNWFAVALDFFIVVAGILIAFQIANWSAYRAERAQEIDYLSAMERDVEYSIGVLEDSIWNLESQQSARQALYEFLADPSADLDPDKLDSLIARGVFALERADINQITFETLKSSGQMSVIKSSELLKALQDLSAELDAAEVDKNEDFQFAFRMSDPLLITEGDFDNILINDLGSMHDKLPWITKQPGAGYDREFVRSRSFKNILLFRTLFGQLRLEGLTTILERHQNILILIDERQAQLGIEP
ncbi:hypothetical protein GCM10009069_23670 [Algimonas arctica]|uniref:Uncharacterized protein n=1 Tax=Algimonas arctica TaxID=1479486 RepID=A0A8J3G371_9PROT|nr:hypothetical protein [Algimonas arctica]GHB00111.1 hypothetical protein GCM10009069_23670 [Algimonas arctica]